MPRAGFARYACGACFTGLSVLSKYISEYLFECNLEYIRSPMNWKDDIVDFRWGECILEYSSGGHCLFVLEHICPIVARPEAAACGRSDRSGAAASDRGTEFLRDSIATLRHRAFRHLWLAVLVADTGAFAQAVGATWILEIGRAHV